MATIVTDILCDLTQPVKVQYLHGNLFSQDNAANTINVHVHSAGVPESLGGTISANVIRSDGGTVAVAGSVSGDTATVVLPQACYAVPGVIHIIIKSTVSSVVTTIAAVVANVYTSSTDTVVDPGTIITDVAALIAQIEAAVDSIPVDYSGLLATIAADYSSSNTYPVVGMYAWQGGVLKRNIVPITTAETYTAAHWTNAVLGDDVSALKSALSENKQSTENGFEKVTGRKSMVFVPGYYRAYDDNRVTDISAPETSNTTSKSMVCCLIPCQAGDVFYIRAYGGATTAGAYGFLDSDCKGFTRGGTNGLYENILIAPANAAYLIVNNKITENAEGYYAIKGYGASYADGLKYRIGDAAVPFDFNSIASSTGRTTENDKRVHALVPEDCIFVNTTSDGYEILIVGYIKSDHSYVGSWNGTSFSTSTSTWAKAFDLTKIASRSSYDLVICVRNTSNTTISSIATAAGNIKFTYTGFDVEESEMAQGICGANIVVYETGSISGAYGTYLNDESHLLNRMRSNAFIPEIINGIGISKPNYQVSVFCYNADGSYVGSLKDDGTTVTKAQWISSFIKIDRSSGKKYRILIRHTDNSSVSIGEDIGIFFTTSEISLLQNVENLMNKYTYYGERIFLNKHEFTMTNMISVPTSKSSQSQQGACIYNDYLFQFYVTGLCDVFDLTAEDNSTPIASFQLDSEISMHCNVAMFGSVKYDSDDDYPVLYVNAYHSTEPRATCYVFRIVENEGTFTATLLQTINIGFANTDRWFDDTQIITSSRPYGNWAVDTERGFLYAYVIRDYDRITRFFKFNIPALSAGSTVTLTTDDILDQFDVEFFRYVQDNVIVGNNIYIAAGYPTITPSIRVVNLATHTYNSLINFNDYSLEFEPEGIDLYKGSLILTGGGYGRKLSFN